MSCSSVNSSWKIFKVIFKTFHFINLNKHLFLCQEKKKPCLSLYNVTSKNGELGTNHWRENRLNLRFWDKVLNRLLEFHRTKKLQCHLVTSTSQQAPKLTSFSYWISNMARELPRSCITDSACFSSSSLFTVRCKSKYKCEEILINTWHFSRGGGRNQFNY